MGGTFFFNYQTFSGNKLTLIRAFKPLVASFNFLVENIFLLSVISHLFVYLFKPLVEIISQNKSFQTFREF